MEEKEARERIISATLELLRSCPDVRAVTLRQISKDAGVALGSINYYFGSKDRLVYLAMGEKMSVLASGYTNARKTGNALERLRTMLLELYRFSAEYRSLMPYLLTQTLRNGDWGAELAMMPLLREICPDADEMRLRTAALQIMAPIQVSAMDAEAFRLYSGIDLADEKARAAFVDILLKTLDLAGERK